MADESTPAQRLLKNSHVQSELKEAIQTVLDELVSERKAGLQRQDANSEDVEDVEAGDNEMAKGMRALFRQEVNSLIEQTEDRPADLIAYTGYVVGIDMFRDVFFAFRDCEAVQICFGLNKPLQQGGQLQLIVRGVGGEVPVLYSTGNLDDGGGPTDPPNVRPCPHNGSCK